MFRVFVDEAGNFGDLASVVIDESRAISDDERQSFTRSLNTGETIFINNIAQADISVMHAHGEIDFAGVGVMAAAFLLRELRGAPIDFLHGRAGDILISQDGDITWAQADIKSMPHWNFKQLTSAGAVEQIDADEMKKMEHTMIWSWLDEHEGLIRARTFAADWGFPEAEGNGSGSMRLASHLGREIFVRHGKGSEIFAKPTEPHSALIGGRVVRAGGRAR